MAARALCTGMPNCMSMNTHAPHPLMPAAMTSFGPVRGFKKARILQRPRIMPVSAAASDFYAQEATSFSSLGIHEDLVKALERNGMTRPAHVQVSRAYAK